MTARHALSKSRIRTRIEHWISSQRYPTLTVPILARRNGLAYVGTQNTDPIQTRLEKVRTGVVSGPLGRNPAHALGSVLGVAERLSQRQSLLRIPRVVDKQSDPGPGLYLFATPDLQETDPVTDPISTSDPEEGGSTPSRRHAK